MENQVIEENPNEKLRAEFFSGVMAGSIDRVIATLEQGVDLNSLTPKGNNALYVAASRKRRDMFEWLLEVTQKGKGIDLDNRNSLGNTTLFECVKDGNQTFYVKKLIEAGANVNIRSNTGMTPLIQACADKKEEEVELLASAPRIQINDSIPGTKTTAFLMACSQSSMKCLKILVANGADQNVVDSDGKNALMNSLYKSQRFMKTGEKREHAELCAYLIDSGIDLNYVAPSGMTAFWAATVHADEPLALKLIEKGANVNVTHEVGMDGKTTPLHLWMQKGKTEMVRAILTNGGKLGGFDAEGNQPESYAFLFEDEELFKLMLEHNLNINATLYTQKGSKKEKKHFPTFPLLLTKNGEYAEVVEEMIKRGVRVTYEEPELQGAEPILIAVSNSKYNIVKLLINTGKIDLNRVYKGDSAHEGLTTLSFLVSSIHSQNLSVHLEQKTLLENILKGKEINEKNGVTSDLVNDEGFEKIKEALATLNQLESSIEASRKEIFDLLLMKGAKVDNPNENGKTEIFFAKEPMFAQWLKDAGANIFHTDNEDRDVLYSSVLNNNANTIPFWKNEFAQTNHPTVDNILYQLAFEDFSKISYLREAAQNGILRFLNNEDINKFLNPEIPPEEKPAIYVKELFYKDEDGNTPLLVACANNSAFLAAFYVTLGADVNMANHLGETPLMHAVATGNAGLVEFLIQEKADLHAKTHEGKTVQDMVAELNHPQIVSMFQHALEKEKAVELTDDKPKLKI